MDKTFVISKKAILFLMALLGLVLTILLAIVYFNANFNPAAGASFCTSQTNRFIDCDTVAKSTDAQFLGIPLAYWGMLFYLIVMFLLSTDTLKKLKSFAWVEVFKNPLSYISFLGLFSFIISMTLAFVSIVFINKICILCVATYVLNFIIGLCASELAGETFGSATKKTFADFFDALKIKKYFVSFICVAVVAVGFLTFTKVSNIFTPQVEDNKIMKAFYEMQTNEYANASKTNTLGDEDAGVIVYTYSDFMCPYCVIENRMFHKVAQDLKNVKIVFVNYPLDKACNKNIPSEFHKGACEMAKLALAAKKQDKFWPMANILFESKTPDTKQLLKLAAAKGIDAKQLEKDATLTDVKQELLDDIDTATAMQIGGTPAFSVDGQLHVGLKPYREMKEILIAAGAKKR